MTEDIVSIARAAYDCYVTKDRAAIEALISDDFHFTSPLDNRIDRATYFLRCWPNSASTEAFDFIHFVRDGERVFVTYEGRAHASRFRNTRCRRSRPAGSPTSRCTLAGRSRTRRQWVRS